MDKFLFWWFWLPMSLCLIGFITFIVAQIANKKKIADVSLCFISWMTLSFIFPWLAKKKGVIKSWWLAVLLMLVSPAAIATYFIFAIFFIGISPYGYKDIKFKSKDDLVTLTHIEDIPDYEYKSNTFDWWDGTHIVKYSFLRPASDDLFDKLESKRKHADIFWSIDTLTYQSDKDYFGCENVYVFRHGWDGQFIKAPNSLMPDNCSVQITIGKKGFIVKYYELSNISFERYANRDSLSQKTNVRMPSYKSIDCWYTAYGPDYAEDWILELDNKPSQEFIHQIETSHNWKKLKNYNGIYEFKNLTERFQETITIDKNSKYIRICYEDF